MHYGEEDGFFYVISGGREIALARTRDLRTWQHAPVLVRADTGMQDAAISPFLGLAQQAAGRMPASKEHAAAAASLRSVLAHPECWEFDVNDADMCCGGPLTAPGAPRDKAYLLFSPSSQGRKPRANCSAIRPVAFPHSAHIPTRSCSCSFDAPAPPPVLAENRK